MEIGKAIKAINPNAKCSVNNEDFDQISWNEGTVPISKDKIEAKMIELQAEYDAQAYARNRASAYPSTGDQLDMIYKDTKNSTTTHADAVEAVKTKWPKDNSGPVE